MRGNVVPYAHPNNKNNRFAFPVKGELVIENITLYKFSYAHQFLLQEEDKVKTYRSIICPPKIKLLNPISIHIHHQWPKKIYIF